MRKRLEIGPDENYGSLSARLAQLGGELIMRALDAASAGELEFTEQDEAQATYAEKILAAERRLDPGRPAEELARTVRALTPHIGAYLELGNGQRLGVLAASAEPGDLEPGALSADGRSLRLGCAEGVLLLRTVQPQAGRPMPVEAYLRGHAVPEVVL
jgi:methionyl-tRNA formyltransferase